VACPIDLLHGTFISPLSTELASTIAIGTSTDAAAWAETGALPKHLKRLETEIMREIVAEFKKPARTSPHEVSTLSSISALLFFTS
jgi:hypothetical protein